jgi:PAS domain S-box-containing protein
MTITVTDTRGTPDPERYARWLRALQEQRLAAEARRSALRADAGRVASLAPDTELLERTLDELDRSLEELGTAEEELREQNDRLLSSQYRLDEDRGRYQSLFRDAPVAQLVTDREGRIRELNAAAVRLLNLPNQFAAGKPLAVYIDPDRRGEFRQLLLRVLQTGGAVEGWTASVLPRLDTPRPVSISVAPAPEGLGPDHRFQWALQELTAAAPTPPPSPPRAVSSERPAIGRRDPDRASEMLRQLAGGLAHVLNNQLTVFSAHIALALTELRHEAAFHPRLLRIRDDLEQAHHAGGRIAEVVRGLLAYSRTDEGSVRAASLPPAVAGTLQKLRHRVPGNVRVSVSLADGLPPVLAEPAGLEQILLALADNAVAAMDSGGELRIEAEPKELSPAGCRAGSEPGPGRYVVIRVSDTGCGIAPEARRRIFDPFFSTKHPSQGAGLGLSVVWGLTARYGGLVRVESEQGRGTTVQVFLPLAEAE